MPYTWKGVTMKMNLATPGESRVDLCWVRFTGRSKLDPTIATSFHVLLRAETFIRYLVDNTDENITMEIREPEYSYSQPVPMVGPGLRIINLTDMNDEMVK